MSETTTSTQVQLVTTEPTATGIVVRAKPGWSQQEWIEAINATGLVHGDMVLAEDLDYEYGIDNDGIEVWTFTR